MHRYSRRRDKPFVAVNVASLSPTLAESELFGHVRGAFTGADQPRKGLLEQADGGTLFLDEVADIPMPIQVKLLRALEHGEVVPVGAEEPGQVDLRIISATHQNLCRRVAEGEFRHDLYFRLVTFELALPPLRERREDIRELAEHFVHLLAAKNHMAEPSISRDLLVELDRRPWYGNVRELRNAIEHAMILATGGNLTPEYLPAPTPAAFTANVIQEEAIATLVRQWSEAQLDLSEPGDDLHERLLALVEPPLLEAAAAHFHGQAATAARRLGLHRTTLRKKWDRYGIEER
ncbi:MAG: sigma-54 dependent transcriptional regulator [Planctomycetia bacterium]|nr:sigma-54 dependent transcriptional regulator [Planctomycetia bacterium]